jgi:hypothetical protein
MSHGHRYNRNATPEQIYDHTLMFWHMHLAVEEPDLAQLRELIGRSPVRRCCSANAILIVACRTWRSVYKKPAA